MKKDFPLLIVGLGNPEHEYFTTRHNLGANALKYIASEWGYSNWRKKFEGEYISINDRKIPIHLLFPLTYMNLSGRSVAKAVKFFHIPLENVLVLHDDVDLEFGIVKLKFGGGLAGHNGLKSIASAFGSKDFMRLRLGIGRPPYDMVNYVLGNFSQNEKKDLPEIYIKVKDIVTELIDSDVPGVMNKFNRRKKN